MFSTISHMWPQRKTTMRKTFLDESESGYETGAEMVYSWHWNKTGLEFEEALLDALLILFRL